MPPGGTLEAFGDGGVSLFALLWGEERVFSLNSLNVQTIWYSFSKLQLEWGSILLFLLWPNIWEAAAKGRKDFLLIHEKDTAIMVGKGPKEWNATSCPQSGCKGRENRKWDWTITIPYLPHSSLLSPVKFHLVKVPEEHHQMMTRSSNTQTYWAHFTFKPQPLLCVEWLGLSTVF